MLGRKGDSGIKISSLRYGVVWYNTRSFGEGAERHFPLPGLGVLSYG